MNYIYLVCEHKSVTNQTLKISFLVELLKMKERLRNELISEINIEKKLE